MYQRMLVPLDGSESAEVALPYAEQLVGKMGDEITLISVVASGKSQQGHIYQVYMQKMVERTAQEIKKQAGKEVNVQSAMLEGDPSEEIVDYAERENIDLIVMATHGRSGIRRWALGSVANKVARATGCAVVLIRAKNDRRDVRDRGTIKRVLVPLDRSETSEAVLPYIGDIADNLKTEVILFIAVEQLYHVVVAGDSATKIPYSLEEMDDSVEDARDYLERVGKTLDERGITTMAEVGIGNAAEGIIELADKIDADLVAMSTHGRSGLGRWTFGSVADKVLHGGTTPLLLVRPH